jgi:hypothetical protein
MELVAATCVPSAGRPTTSAPAVPAASNTIAPARIAARHRFTIDGYLLPFLQPLPFVSSVCMTFFVAIGRLISCSSTVRGRRRCRRVTFRNLPVALIVALS